jgi:hypothetical protein
MKLILKTEKLTFYHFDVFTILDCDKTFTKKVYEL